MLQITKTRLPFSREWDWLGDAVNWNKMRLPTCEEYDLLATTAKEDNDTMHWSYMLSWCQDVDPGSTSHRAVRGWVSARYWNNDNATYRYVDVGFRPVVEILNPDILGPDGATIMIGTLYILSFCKMVSRYAFHPMPEAAGSGTRTTAALNPKGVMRSNGRANTGGKTEASTGLSGGFQQGKPHLLPPWQWLRNMAMI